MSKYKITNSKYTVNEEIVAKVSFYKVNKGDHLIVLKKEKRHIGMKSEIFVRLVITKEEIWVPTKKVRKLHKNESKIL